MYFVSLFFFFFSSRRRHTRFDCDWSSDVCSSDLAPVRAAFDLRRRAMPLACQPRAPVPLLPKSRQPRSRCSHSRVLGRDRKSTRLNSSHSQISYAVFCLKKKKNVFIHPSSPPPFY